MIEFEIDPNLVADAIRDGRMLSVKVSPDGKIVRVVLGQLSPYRKQPQKDHP